MTMPVEVLWPTQGWSSSDWLGMNATWTLPLSQSSVSPERIDELERSLLREMQVALDLGVSAGLGGKFAPETRNEIHQIGSAAEDFHGMFAWIKDLPHEVLVALLAERTARGLSVLVGYVKGKVEGFRREEQDGIEITAQFAIHPDLLINLCLEHAYRAYEVTSYDSATWRVLTDQERATVEQTWPPREQYWVEIEGNSKRLSYRADDSGTVHEHSVNSMSSETPVLIPDVNPVPVPPVYREPSTGEEVVGWPSQDGIDRSEHIAIIAKLEADFGDLIEDEEFIDRAGQIGPMVQRELERAVELTIREIVPDTAAFDTEAEYYQIGPAAGGIVDIGNYIVELVQTRDALPALIGNLAEAWVIYEIVSRVKRKLDSWVSTFNDSRLAVALSFPPAVLVALCESYVRRHYHPRAKLSTEWYCLTPNFYAGYVSPGHPSEAVEYLIVVKTSRKSYRFRLWGNGKVVSLWMKEGRIEIELPRPAAIDGGT